MEQEPKPPREAPPVPTALIEQVEKYMPGIGPKLRPILEGLSSRGCDLNRVVEAVLEGWSSAFPETLRRGLFSEAIPGTAKCNAVFEKFDPAARALLAITQLPDGARERPALASEIGPRLRELLDLVQQLHDRTAELLNLVGTEVRKHRVSIANAPKGRPRAWYRNADQAFVAAGVPLRARRALRRLIAEHMGLGPHYRRAEK